MTTFKLRLRVSALCLLTVLIGANPALAESDDDILLLLPSIIAGTKQTPTVGPDIEPRGLQKIKQLHGKWSFLFSPGPEFVFEEFFKFDRSTARQTSDTSLFTIGGDSSVTADFLSTWCDGGLIASYNLDFESDQIPYLILCDWGFPTTDLGNAFFFNSVSGSFPFVHYYYLPSTGELSTGVPTLGTATRFSAAFKSAPMMLERKGKNGGQNNQINLIKRQLYAEYLKQKTSARKTSDTETTQLSKRVKRVLQIPGG